MKTWIITIAAVLVVCLLLGALCYAEFGSIHFFRVGLALSKTMGTDAVCLITESPERVWLVGTQGGLDAFRTHLEAEGWQLRMDEQLGALIPVERGGIRDYVHWSVNGMYHKFTWEHRGEAAREPDATQPEKLYAPESFTHTAYFYPETGTGITVTTAAAPTFAYPAPGAFTAQPDGTLTDRDGTQYHRLHWESEAVQGFSLTEGFCVAGSDTAAFLEDALRQLGLSSREANDFLLCFLPRMTGSAYNRICFHTYSGLSVSPAPQTRIGVYMLWEPLSEPLDIAPQTLTGPERSGFTLVEWGGGPIK